MRWERRPKKRWGKLAPRMAAPPPRSSAVVAPGPDPRSSHMALYFDQSVEALLSSATAVDFVEDRFLFPWPKPKHDAPHTADAHADEPGAGFILFRSAQPGAAGSDF